jgi:hypothetical protein
LYSKSIFPIFGIVIGLAMGGIVGAVIGFFAAAIVHGLFVGIRGRFL